MNNPQKNRLSMFLAVLGVMNEYSSAWSALSAIQDILTRLTALVDAIQTHSGIHKAPRAPASLRARTASAWR